MEAAVHSHDVLSTELTEDELTGVALHGRDREVRDIFVRKLCSVSYL